MKNSSVYLLGLAHYFSIIAYHGSRGFTLVVKHYDILKVVQPDYELSWYEYFPNLNADERHSLCRQATEIAKLDAVKDPPAHEVMNYFIRNDDLIHLIRCRTVPLAYLHYDKSSKDVIVIAMEKNKFIGNQFDVGIIDYLPIPCSKMLENDPRYFEVDPHEFMIEVKSVCDEDRMLRISHIRKYWKNEVRVHLCTAAKKYLQEAEPRHGGLIPVFQSDRVAKAEIFYDAKRDDLEKVKHYALRCPTHPAMYLYFLNLRVSTAVKVLLPTSDAKYEYHKIK